LIPAAIFCGDVLLVGDVGRPDLFPGMARKLASEMYDSLHKIIALPDYCEVYPAHVPGSYNIMGGMTGFNAAGYTAECLPCTAATHLPAKG
jgi:glyoxylase-like metal-dependent hydrolase (beta-lactamase superfamily II)